MNSGGRNPKQTCAIPIHRTFCGEYNPHSPQKQSPRFPLGKHNLSKKFPLGDGPKTNMRDPDSPQKKGPDNLRTPFLTPHQSPRGECAGHQRLPSVGHIRKDQSQPCRCQSKNRKYYKHADKPYKEVEWLVLSFHEENKMNAPKPYPTHTQKSVTSITSPKQCPK